MWKIICGFSVYVENNKIIRAMKNHDTLPAAVYKKSKNGGWDKVENCNVYTFKAGYYKGNYTIM